MFTIRRTTIILILQCTTMQMYRHNKPLTEKIWSERCTKNSIVLNDCNWCRCNANQKYDCKARICEEIDMFGHFKDAIQEIDVGMEGHGSWRSRVQACTPGVHYRRGDVLCVCDEEGSWPNPVCRDLFQILHSVKVAEQTRLSKNDSCSPTQLYLVGCNVCFCPSSGYLDLQMCTKKECQEDDPAIEVDQTRQRGIAIKSKDGIEEVLEIYAMCDPKFKYELGCRYCKCLRNNRLLCGNCTKVSEQYPISLGERKRLPYNITNRSKLGGSNKANRHIRKPNMDSLCRGKKEFEVFKVDCNLCHCGRLSNIFCTVKKCLNKNKRLKSTFDIDNLVLGQTNLVQAEHPADDVSCVPGTKFKRGCNVCECATVVKGVKRLVCTLKICKGHEGNVIAEQKFNCVSGTYFQEHCMLCHCYIKNKIKYLVCLILEACIHSKNSMKLHGVILEDVKSLFGFCTPMKRYKNNCNTCRCLSDGKTVECSSKLCFLRSEYDLSVDIVPVIVENDEVCLKGHSYKLDCNLCFCLSNGNAICTTIDCSKQNRMVI